MVSHAVAERDAIKETVKEVIPDSDGPPPDSPVSFNMEEPPTPASSVSSAENGVSLHCLLDAQLVMHPAAHFLGLCARALDPRDASCTGTVWPTYGKLRL